MIEVKPHHDGERVAVRFTVPLAYGPLAVVGDFNDWDNRAAPLEADGDWQSVTVTLRTGRCYRFRYVSEHGAYCNDETADDYEPNEYGGFNCVLDLRDGAASHDT